MRPSLDIRGAGAGGYAVLLQGKVLARATSHGNAVARARGLARELASTTRLCLCCNTPFKSAGKGHRLCPPCRRGA